MTKNCPHGWKTSIKTGNISLVNHTVEICDGICNFVDLCGIKDCEYYDDTEEGTRKFQKALAYEHTMEGMMEAMKTQNKKMQAGFR